MLKTILRSIAVWQKNSDRFRFAQSVTVKNYAPLPNNFGEAGFLRGMLNEKAR
jgi:hypothetical protein